ncbi:MAG: Oxidoreductase, aldo/keto reductase family, partial [uncultured Thiotrichaceae bacterium]
NDWPKVQSIQNPYSLLNRLFEVGLAEMSLHEEVGLLAYSPLGFGVLSGKYLHGQKPKNARLTITSDYGRYSSENAVRATAAYAELAREHNMMPSQMALAFVNSRKFVTSNIIGATSMEQLQENIGSIEISLSEEVIGGIEKIHSQIPDPSP